MELPSSRYFLWAERLLHRPGAVRGARAAAQHRARAAAPTTPSVGPATAAGEEVRRIDDPRELERLTNQPGFMGFEYAGG